MSEVRSVICVLAKRTCSMFMCVGASVSVKLSLFIRRHIESVYYERKVLLALYFRKMIAFYAHGVGGSMWLPKNGDITACSFTSLLEYIK